MITTNILHNTNKDCNNETIINKDNDSHNKDTSKNTNINKSNGILLVNDNCNNNSNNSSYKSIITYLKENNFIFYLNTNKNLKEDSLENLLHKCYIDIFISYANEISKDNAILFKRSINDGSVSYFTNNTSNTSNSNNKYEKYTYDNDKFDYFLNIVKENSFCTSEENFLLLTELNNLIKQNKISKQKNYMWLDVEDYKLLFLLCSNMMKYNYLISKSYFNFL